MVDRAGHRASTIAQIGQRAGPDRERPDVVGIEQVALGHDPVYGAANGAPPCARFELADDNLGLVVEGGDDLVGVLFRVVKSQAADREIDEVMSVPRSRPG